MEGVPDYELVWPRWLFQAEAAALLNSRDKLSDWDDRCELLLEDAFAGITPGMISALRTLPRGGLS